MPKVVWSNDFYVSAYEHARAGFSYPKIANALGVHVRTLKEWMMGNKAFRHAIKRGRDLHRQGGQRTFRDYVFKRLPPRLQEVWVEINECEEEDNGILRLEALLDSAGKKARQHLFLYALVDSNFNPSEACRRVNIPRKTYEHWKNHDPGFSELVDEIHWHKGNFFEEHLVQAVKDGNVAATLFANSTFNKDRGYSTKVTVEHQGEVQHNHTVDLATLNLSLEIKQAILDAIEEREQQLHQQARIVDATSVVPLP